MKKRILCFMVVISTLLFCSCTFLQPHVEGDELIKKAREDYKNLDSAKVVMTNMDTNEVEQTFTFKYDEKGMLTFAYEGKNGSDEYAQYGTPTRYATYEKGELKQYDKNDKDFIAYTKDSTHPQASEELIVFTPRAVAEATKTEEDKLTHIHHKYDPEKIKADQEIKEFSVDYYFDVDGELLYFIENSALKSDGKTNKHSYKVEITEKNAIKKVPDTVAKYE
ncbi:MAG: hypothetical protein ACI4RN_02775 [Oscillospiraceae bacterium]